MEKTTKLINFIYEHIPNRDGFITTISPNGDNYAVVNLKKNGKKCFVFFEEDKAKIEEILGSGFQELLIADDFIVVGEKQEAIGR